MIKFVKEFDYIKIKLASPNQILKWSNRKLPNGKYVGEIKNSETINYKTLKPEMGGLFCERIFGPIQDFECACGQYKYSKYEKLMCEDCYVEIIEAKVRRYRMGHIKLCYPVTHVWYVNSRPNFLALILEVQQCEKKLNIINETATSVEFWDARIKRIKLTSLIYFIAESDIELYNLHWDLYEYRRSRERGESNYALKSQNFSNKKSPSLLFKSSYALLGTALIKQELEKLNLEFEAEITRAFLFDCINILAKQRINLKKWEQQRIFKLRDQAIQRIRILENLIGTESHPTWMILSILPVIPAALRPMIQLEAGQFITSDLNELYRQIIVRNSRLQDLLNIHAPQLVIRNEKRLLQEAVDNLIDNGKRGEITLSAQNHPLKSLSTIIKGKHGRFRQNLLGKRVDYSGRSVIVVGPNLQLNQCGLPYEMAIELFQPFVIKELMKQGLATNIQIAENLIKKNEFFINKILKKILINHPIFLNRAPTLHRLGIQAFEPIIIPGRAIKLHPLVCSAFNADFDGDQMAIHIPLSIESQAECYTLMLAPYNFLSPANGEPIISPSQEMVLGCYYLTINNISGLLGSNHYFANLEDVILAYNQNIIEIHSSIWVRIKNINQSKSDFIKQIKLNDNSSIEYYNNLQIKKNKNGEIIVQYIKTTAGRVILNYTIQKTLNFL